MGQGVTNPLNRRIRGEIDEDGREGRGGTFRLLWRMTILLSANFSIRRGTMAEATASCKGNSSAQLGAGWGGHRDV